MMGRAFGLLAFATWLWIVNLRVVNSNAATVAEFGGVVYIGGWWDIRPGVDGEDAPSRCEPSFRPPRPALPG